MRRKICTVAAIVWMILIFAFSSRTGNVSSEDSGRVGRFVGETFVPTFNDWSKEKQQAFVDKVDHPIRKTAHATEYAILGMLLCGAIYDRKKQRRMRTILPWIIGTLYAATDEFHQLFVPGRSGQITDVMLDSTGVLVGVFLIYMIWNHRIQKKIRHS